MSYTPIHNYRVRDKLPPNDPGKIIYGSHLSDDFEAISRALGAIEGSLNSSPIFPDGGTAACSAEWGKITGTIGNQSDLQTALSRKVDKTALDVISGGTY
jgi:hypothetical protein